MMPNNRIYTASHRDGSTIRIDSDASLQKFVDAYDNLIGIYAAKREEAENTAQNYLEFARLQAEVWREMAALIAFRCIPESLGEELLKKGRLNDLLEDGPSSGTGESSARAVQISFPKQGEDFDDEDEDEYEYEDDDDFEDEDEENAWD